VSLERVAVHPSSESADGRLETILQARRRGFRSFVVPPGDLFQQQPAERWFVLENEVICSADRSSPPFRAPIVHVRDPETLDSTLKQNPRPNVVVVRWEGERLIPLENAIAARGGNEGIWVITQRPEDVPGALGALEYGAERVVVDVPDLDALARLERLLESRPTVALAWELVTVSRVESAGMGDRILVDTTSILRPEEGLLVGSSAGFLYHVVSEAIASRYTRPRPFRVNAGSAHSYVLLADGSTRYLSELSPGEPVLVCDPKGAARSVRVGRIKMERRPLVLVESERHGRRPTVFLQEAETVRLSTESGALSTAHLTKGARVYGVALPPARHMGMEIEESIEER